MEVINERLIISITGTQDRGTGRLIELVTVRKLSYGEDASILTIMTAPLQERRA
jgi:hypothetical protein